MDNKEEQKKETQKKEEKKPTFKEKVGFIVDQAKKVKWAKMSDTLKSSLIVSGVSIGMICFFALIDYAAIVIKDIF